MASGYEKRYGTYVTYKECEYETCDRSIRRDPKCDDLTNLELRLMRRKTGSAGVDSSTDDSEELATAAVRFLDLRTKSKVTIDVCSIEILSSFQVKMARR